MPSASSNKPKWFAYMQERGVLTVSQNNPSAAVYAKGLRILPACNGQEELRVCFGVEDEVVKKAMAQFREATREGFDLLG